MQSWPGIELPYRLCRVRLDEGPLILSNLAGEEEVKLGGDLHAAFEKTSGEVAMPMFARDHPI